MKQRQNHTLALVLVIADLAALWASFEVTAFCRIELNRLLPHVFTRELVQSYFPPLPLVALCWGVTLFMTGAYDLLGKRSFTQIGLATAKAVTLAMGLQIVFLFFFSRLVYARSLALLFFGISLVFLTSSRQLAFIALRKMKAHGIGAEPVAVVGTGPMARLLAAKIAADREPRFRFVGFVADALSTPRELDDLSGQILGHVEKAEKIINELSLRRIFVTNPGASTQEALAMVLLCDRLEVGLESVPDFIGLISERVRVTELDGVPLLSFQQVRITAWAQILKRTVDIVGSTLGLVALAPVFAVVGLAIRLDSRGSILYAQKRVGKGGKYFKLFKFRSMLSESDGRRAQLEAENEATGHIFKIKDDPRVTRVGRFIRRYSIDELPQLGNVLIGDMSLVGPRPLPKDDIEDPDSPYNHWITRRRAVRPGISGLWQVSGRSQLPFKEMVNLDLHYINNWSLALDLQILLRTLPVVFKGDGAY